MNEHHLHLTGVDIVFTPHDSAPRLRPAVHNGTIHLTNQGFVTMVRQAFREDIVLPFVTLRYVDCRFIAGGAEMTLLAQTPIIQHNVRVRLGISMSERGYLRLQIHDVRAGLFPVTRLVDPLLGYVERQRGVSRVGPRIIDVDLAEVLRSRNVPLELASPLRWVSATPEALVLEFG